MVPRALLSAVLFDAQAAAPHRLPTTALALSVEGTLSVETEARRGDASAFVLGANTTHAGASTGPHVIVLVDELGGYGRTFSSSHRQIHSQLGWLRTLQRAVVAHASELTTPGVLLPLVDDVLQTAARREDWRAAPLDARVERCLEAIERAVRRGEAVPSPVIQGVSPAHLRALFRRDMGMTISEHARRRRLLAALAIVAGGKNATHAAAEAGFADSAHFSRTTRSAFGTTLATIRAGKPLHVDRAASG